MLRQHIRCSAKKYWNVLQVIAALTARWTCGSSSAGQLIEYCGVLWFTNVRLPMREPLIS